VRCHERDLLDPRKDYFLKLITCLHIFTREMQDWNKLYCTVLTCINIHTYITFCGSKIVQNDCRIWSRPYSHKDTYTIQLKHFRNTYTNVKSI
jgi:hypothetical protein